MNLLKISSLFIVFSTILCYGSILQVHRISSFGANAFILETENSLFLIDAGYPKQEKKILDTINTLHKNLVLIILTHAHFDHFGSVKKIKEATGALVGIHYLDSANLCNGVTALDSVNFWGFLGKIVLPLAEKILPPEPVCPDILFRDGDMLDKYGLTARIVHTPGHTVGSCSIIVDDSLAFAGDLITNTIFFNKQKFFANSWSQIDQSIEKLYQQRFTTVFVGHNGKTIDKEGVGRLTEK